MSDEASTRYSCGQPCSCVVLLQVAKAAKAGGCKVCHIVSSVGANKDAVSLACCIQCIKVNESQRAFESLVIHSTWKSQGNVSHHCVRVKSITGGTRHVYEHHKYHESQSLLCVFCLPCACDSPSASRFLTHISVKISTFTWRCNPLLA